MDNSPETWLPSGDSEVKLYQRFKERFGSDSFLALVSQNPAPGHEKLVLELEQRLNSIEGLGDVMSPFKQGTQGEAPSTRHLLSEDGQRYALLIKVPQSTPPTDIPALISEVEQLALQYPKLGAFTLVGTEVVTRDLNRGSERSFGGLFPLVAVALSFLLWRAFRSFRVVLAVFTSVAFAALTSLGTMAIAGRSLNLLVVLMPAILVVLTVAASVHLCQAYVSLASRNSQASSAERDEVWAQAMSATAKPCLLATVTTSLGFASLSFSQVGPVRDLGLFTALGAFWVLLASFTLVPTLLRGSTVRAADSRKDRARIASYLTFLSRVRIPVLTLGLLSFALLAAGLPRIRIESNVMKFFEQSHPLPAAYQDFEENFFGLTAFELVLDGPLNRVAADTSLDILENLEKFARSEGLTSDFLSPWLPGEGSADLSERELRGLLGSGAQQRSAQIPDDLKAYLWRGGASAALRVTLLAPTGSSNQAYRSVTRLRDKIAQTALPPGVNLRVQGAAPLLVRGQVLLLNTQISSFATALLGITLVIIIAYRSLRLTLLSLVCNVLPVMGVLGLMAWLAIPLDAGTVTVAGIALGLIVDDTIHIIHGFAESPTEGALRDTLEKAGKPILITTVAVALGFGLFSFASFQPTKYFGLLTAATSCLALIADLVLLPALLLSGANNKPPTSGPTPEPS